MALDNLADKTVVRKALHDWYEQKQKNYDAWAKVYPIHLNETEYHKIDKPTCLVPNGRGNRYANFIA